MTEQEKKTKRRFNLVRVLCWTLLISVLSVLVLFYFSFIFPIPAVEIETAGIPQTKEKYEQELFREKITNYLGNDFKIDSGDKIIQLFDLRNFHNDFGFVYSKFHQYWLFVSLESLSYRIENQRFNFEINGSEVIGCEGIEDNNKNPRFLVFNRDKQELYHYNLDGKNEKTSHLLKDSKIVYNSYLNLPQFVMGNGTYIENWEQRQTISNLEHWNSNDIYIIKNLSDYHANENFVLSDGKISKYNILSDIVESKSDSIVKYDGDYYEISFGLPIINSNDGVYYFDIQYFYDEKTNITKFEPKFFKILDEPINKDSILVSDLDSVLFGKQFGNNYYIYYIDCRDYAGISDDYGTEKFNTLMWRFVVPGNFKWYSKYSNVICTDKGFFTIDTLIEKLHTPRQFYFDKLQYARKNPYKLKLSIPFRYIREYPYIYLYGKGNYALKHINDFLKVIYDYFIVNAYVLLTWPMILIVLFILSRTETKKIRNN